jgi:hypothetical protein
MRSASLVPACGHSFCSDCIQRLPLTRTFSGRQARCPICRIDFLPSTAVPNWSLRSQAVAPDIAAEAAAVQPARSVATFSVAEEPRVQATPPEGALEALQVPPGLARLVRDEANRIALRLFILDNSGSTLNLDGHVMKGARLIQSTRWEEICQSAQIASSLGAATGVPCEFHLLNPLRGLNGDTIEGEDYIRTVRDADGPRLSAFLRRLTPGGVTPLAERLNSLSPRFDAFKRVAGHSGRIAFLVILTDGAPTPPNSGTPTQGAAEAALGALRRISTSYPVRLVCRLCTDDDSAVEFWNRADEEEEVS